MHPITTMAEASQRHQQMLRAAEQWRLARAQRRHHAGRAS